MRSDASHACGGRDGELDRGGGRVSATGERATGCGDLGGEEEEVQGLTTVVERGRGRLDVLGVARIPVMATTEQRRETRSSRSRQGLQVPARGGGRHRGRRRGC